MASASEGFVSLLYILKLFFSLVFITAKEFFLLVPVTIQFSFTHNSLYVLYVLRVFCVCVFFFLKNSLM